METKISLISGLEKFVLHTEKNIQLINALVEQIEVQDDEKSEELIQNFADHIADFSYDIVDFFDINLDNLVNINKLSSFNAKDEIISALSIIIENQDSTTVLLEKFLDAYYDSWEKVQQLDILETVPYAISHLEDSKQELSNLINKLK